MTITPKPRPHLIERAVEALGGAVALERIAKAPAGVDQPTGPGMGVPGVGIAGVGVAGVGTLAPAFAETLANDTAPSALPGSGAGYGTLDPAAAPLGSQPPNLAPPNLAPPNPTPSNPPARVSAAVLKAAGLVAAAAGTMRSRLSEEVNLVHHQVLRTVRKTPTADGRCGRIILVTSARPNEGKTFTSLNLAASIAAGGRSQVVLVDADGKRGSLSSLLGLADAPGLRILAGDPRLRGPNLLVPTAQERLFILPFGAQAPGGPELPPGEMLAAAILRTALALPEHVLVVDSPPCLSTSDPSSLAPIAGQVLLVIQAERTQQNEVESALDLVDACPTLQLMLNRTKLTTSHTFGAYGEYDVYGAYGSRPSG